ncbi:MAG: YigZ family protein [Bacteroidaceae bacterium]|nr:YigZ family protein [Bacteroidaceae bacterium]
MTDIFKTIASQSEGQYTEKRSKFLAFAFPVSTVDEIKVILEEYQKKYYDARHVCYAYLLGHERLVFRANDNGEPSGTAGKPILGQINSNELTDILIIVVRYFGGVKLGTSGLIQAYKAAAAEAIAAATIIEKTVDEQVTVTYEYPLMNQVMRVVKEEEPSILSQSFDNDCRMTLAIRASLMPRLRQRLEKIEGVRITE